MGATHFVSVDLETIKFQPPITKWPEKTFPDVMYVPKNDPYYEEKPVPLIDGASHSGVELWVSAVSIKQKKMIIFLFSFLIKFKHG